MLRPDSFKKAERLTVKLREHSLLCYRCHTCAIIHTDGQKSLTESAPLYTVHIALKGDINAQDGNIHAGG